MKMQVIVFIEIPSCKRRNRPPCNIWQQELPKGRKLVHVRANIGLLRKAAYLQYALDVKANMYWHDMSINKKKYDFTFNSTHLRY